MCPGGRKKLHGICNCSRGIGEEKIKESNNADLRVFCNTSARLLFNRGGGGGTSSRLRVKFLESLRTLFVSGTTLDDLEGAESGLRVGSDRATSRTLR